RTDAERSPVREKLRRPALPATVEAPTAAPAPVRQPLLPPFRRAFRSWTIFSGNQTCGVESVRCLPRADSAKMRLSAPRKRARILTEAGTVNAHEPLSSSNLRRLAVHVCKRTGQPLRNDAFQRNGSN